jgi:hypothetical protein
MADADNLGGPGTETPATESDASLLDVRRPSVADLDRHLSECDIYQVPAPAGVHVRAGDDATVGNTLPAPACAALAASTCALVVNFTRND